MLKKLLFLTMIISLVTFQSCSEEDEVIASVQDCAGTIGGTAVEDDCGVCGGDGSTCTDCAGEVNGTAVEDCAGTCEGTAVVDNCDVCGGDNSTCTDCAGVVNGTAAEDCAGTCEGTAVEDCLGACGGSAVVDDCGDCDGNNAAQDCAGVCNGNATVDCNGDCAGTAVEDCAGTCGGTALEDCAGTCGGSAIEDQCGVCGGDNSTCTDCAGVINGTSTEDACGVCDGSAASLDDCLASGACSLPENSMYISSTGQLWYNSTEAIGGVQFAIQGSSFNSADSSLLGDAANTDWTVTVGTNAGIVLALSFTGSSVPAGCGEMFQLDIADPSAITGLGSDTQFIVSSTTGTALSFTYYTGE